MSIKWETILSSNNGIQHKTPYEKALELIELAKEETDPVIRELRLKAADRYLTIDIYIIAKREHAYFPTKPERLIAFTECFSWLHLTDLHQGMKEQNWLRPGVEERFFEDLKRLHDKCGPWDLVLWTGDLTQRGSVEEFQQVDEFLEQLWRHFKELGSSPDLLAVPGNHDLVRPDARQSTVRILLRWSDTSDVQTEFWDEVNSPYRQVVTQAFGNYRAWWTGQTFRSKGLSAGIMPGDFSVTIEKNGARLGIVGLNTAFLQLTGGDYEGKLALHVRQFHEVCGDDGPHWAKQHHACLLLTHHPPVWLNPESLQHLEGEITDHGRFAVHLCGHLHEVAYRDISEGGAEARRIWQCRSLFGLEFFGEQKKVERLHGYSAGRIELAGDRGILTFWPREARLQGAERNIVPDYSVNLTDNQQTEPKNFKLLQPYVSRDLETESPSKTWNSIDDANDQNDNQANRVHSSLV